MLKIKDTSILDGLQKYYENSPKNTDEHLRILEKMDTTSRNDVSNWWRSHELIGVGCEVKVKNWGQITDYTLTYEFSLSISSILNRELE